MQNYRAKKYKISAETNDMFNGKLIGNFLKNLLISLNWGFGMVYLIMIVASFILHGSYIVACAASLKDSQERKDKAAELFKKKSFLSLIL